jgi:hypothetical protein
MHLTGRCALIKECSLKVKKEVNICWPFSYLICFCIIFGGNVFLIRSLSCCIQARKKHDQSMNAYYHYSMGYLLVFEIRAASFNKQEVHWCVGCAKIMHIFSIRLVILHQE